MKFVEPMVVDESNLTSNVVNDDAEWSAGTYSLGARATEGEFVYEVVADPSTTHQPSVGVNNDPPTWILLGYANRMRMWREGVDSPSETVGDIEVSLPVPTVISTVGVLNAVGLEVNVRLEDASIVNIEAPIVENIAGTKNGSNTAFTITEDGAEVLVFLNRQKLTEGTGYTRVGTAITAVDPIPESGDSYIAVIYTADEPTIENIAGTKNGSNTAFTITSATGKVMVFLNGSKLTEGTGYTRSGVNITATGQIPASGDVYEAVIFPGTLPTIENVSGTKDGSNTAFLISTSGHIELFLNGARQIEGTDFTRSGIDVTMTTAPESTDSFEVVLYPDILFPGGVVYDVTKTITDIGVGDWWEFFFTAYERSTTVVFDDLPAYFGADVTLYITIFSTGPSDPSSVGRVVVGPAIPAGISLMGVTSRNLTFTQKTRDEFGNLTLVPRRTIRVVDFPVMIPKGDTYYVQQKAAALAATPTLYIADPNLPETIVFGVFESFDIIVNGLSLVEGSIGVEEF